MRDRHGNVKANKQNGFQTTMLERRRGRANRVTALAEELEPRVLLSHSALSHSVAAAVRATDATQFVIYHPNPKSSTGTPHVAGAVDGLTPAQVRAAYGVNQIAFGGVTGDGAGQTIAIVDAYNDPTIQSDLRAFDGQFGLPDTTLTVMNQTGGTSLPRTDPSGPGDSWAVEISLDVEWAHAMAPAAKIILVEANSDSNANLMRAVDTARNLAGVSVVSISWGSTEDSTATSNDSHFLTPAGHIGVTFLVSSGDNGAFDSGTSTRTVDYPAASPNVVAVGGTTLNVSSNGTYISEQGWGSGSSSFANGGSGGGISVFESQPAYQHGIVTQTTTKRAVPDVAFDADPNSGVAVYDSWDDPTSPWDVIGGTSLSAPSWAGIIAVADQGRAATGLATLTSAQTLSLLYTAPTSDFHDVTTGSNGYSAGTGYDLVTGRGSPVANRLVGFLAGGVTVTPPTQTGPTIASLSSSAATVTAGTVITLTANGVTQGTSALTSVNFYRDTDGTAGLNTATDTLIGVGTQNGSAWTINTSTTGFAGGTQTYFAVATDTAGNLSPSVSASVTISSPTTPPPVTSGGNNNFANATAISGTTISVTGSNAGANKEKGEPNVAGNSGGKSVWYSWTAPSSGLVSLDTEGSNFDTLLGVYTGTVVNKLGLVASNDDVGFGDVTSAVFFNAVAGTTYHFVVDGYRGASGSIKLNLLMATPPANDNFANGTVLTGRPASWLGTNVGASRQSGEPVLAGSPGGASVWFTWVAPTSGVYSLNTLGSDFDTMLGVYTGTSITGLHLVASNDDDASSGALTSALSFNAVAGTTYHFVVDGYAGATGNISLNLT